jgi:hypothetical protein
MMTDELNYARKRPLERDIRSDGEFLLKDF